MRMTERLHFGLIGCGSFGKELGRYLQEVAVVSALCDPNEEGMDGLRCVEMMEADYRSADENGAWMDLLLYPDLEL